MEKIADATGTSVAEVYGVVCFYAQFTTSPKGKHVINVCLGTACYVKGAQALIDEAMSLTGAEINKTSEDGIFSLDATRCLGACGLAPVCIIDGKVFGNCTKDTITAEIRKIQAAEHMA
jgi:NADH:ubiquinone oxidoreductase subunit E